MVPWSEDRFQTLAVNYYTRVTNTPAYCLKKKWDRKEFYKIEVRDGKNHAETVKVC
jgi:hypothetical protein